MIRNFLENLFRKNDPYALKIKSITGYYPNQTDLYNLAFVHKSVLQGKKDKARHSNERLEFLGDAVLDVIISHYLFTKFPYKDEGYLTKLRSKLVSRQFLNNLAVKIGLNEMVEYKMDREVKSIYGDALEALIGAIYLDQGYSKVEEFVLHKLIGIHINIEELISIETDYKSRAIEWSQKEKKKIQFKCYEMESGANKYYNAELLIDDEVMSKGTGPSKKKAEQMASETFISSLS